MTLTALLIDNYDSYTYNIRQLLSSQNIRVKTITNDELSWRAIRADILPGCDFVALGPGPGRLENVEVRIWKEDVG